MSVPSNQTRTARPGGLHRLFFHPRVALVAMVALILSFALPEQGVGIDLCPFNSLTNLPCPGCGLTRSVIAISGRSWAQAWGFNPFGFAAYGMFLICAPWLFVPRSTRDRLLTSLDPHRRKFGLVGLALALAMIVFGTARLVFCAWTGAVLPL